MTQSEWDKLHACAAAGEFPNSFSETLTHYWLLGNRNHIKYGADALPSLDGKLLPLLKRQNIGIYACANRIVFPLLWEMHDKDLCIGLFNKEGILLKLYGDEPAVARLAELGIPRLSNWGLNSIGANAVSIGLETGTAQITIGVENYAKALYSMALYFCPIIAEDSSGAVSLCQGGLAIMIPVEKAHISYFSLVSALSYDVNMHFFLSGRIERVYSTEESGMLNIDLNIVTGKRSVIYHSQNIFSTLGIPVREIKHHSVDELIDPLPANKVFWQIIENRETVSNKQLVLTVNGVSRHLSITTESYSQPHLRIGGIRVFLTSNEVLSSRISRSIGNQAIATFADLLGKSCTFKSTINKAKIYASTTKNILITGESSTGRSSFAQAIHNASSCASGPFITFDCASFSRTHLEQELFGLIDPETHSVLQFGKLELAKGGTLFLKNFDMLPMSAQAALNSAIEQGVFCRVNESTPITLNVRFIASTQEDLANLANKRHFRADLYYNMDALKLPIPPLRERRQDIALLADYFVRQLSMESRGNAYDLSPEAKKLLSSLPWDGNIRQLRNTVEGVVLVSHSSVIEPDDFIRYIGSGSSVQSLAAKGGGRHKISKGELEQTLVDVRYNKMAAAKQLGISRRTLYRYLEKYGIPFKD